MSTSKLKSIIYYVNWRILDIKNVMLFGGRCFGLVVKPVVRIPPCYTRIPGFNTNHWLPVPVSY